MSTAASPSGTLQKLRVLIADDEVLARARLAQLLSLEPGVELVGECADGREALRAIDELRPELILLDLRMPELDGLTVAQTLQLRAVKPLIIFITAHEIPAPAAYAVQACDYLLKPCTVARLREALARARTQLASGAGPSPTTAESLRHRLMVRTGDRMVVVAADEIDWFESANNYVILHVGRATHILRDTLIELEARLSSRHFLRVSRAAAVNPARVREIAAAEEGGHNVILRDGTRIAVTRRIREVQTLLEIA